jgi:hypothetical protein
VEIRYALWTVLSLALTSAPSAISARARRRSLCQAAVINCWFSRACCFGSSLAGGLTVSGAAGRLVRVGLLTVADGLGCCDGPETVGFSALQAVAAKTAVASTADIRMGLTDQASAFHCAAQLADRQPPALPASSRRQEQEVP